MKVRHMWLIGAVLLAATVVILALLAPGGQDSLAAGATIHVDIEAGGDSDGSSWADAFTNLQSALDAAAAGDEIWVAAGIYTPTHESSPGDPRSASFQMKNGVALYGGFDPDAGDIAWHHRDWEANPTILSGDLNGDDAPEFANNEENSYHVFFHPSGLALDGSAILDGFTITGGNATERGGGGMQNVDSSPTLTNCTFSGNSAAGGGGMENAGTSRPALANCTFSGNSADHGGGMANSHNSGPTLTSCMFLDNSADHGGGMANIFGYSAPTLTNCIFSGNSANYGGGMYNLESSPTMTNVTFTGNSAPHGGGGVYNSSSSPGLTDCTFTGNSANTGGGMRNYDSAPALAGCTFSGNSASVYGGGMYNHNASPVLTNCTFSGNMASISGAGMFNQDDSSPWLTNCIFANNSADYGGAVRNDSSSPTLTNCILWDNGPEPIHNSGSSPIVTYSDVQGSYEGEGNIDAEPLFVDPVNGDFHLGPDSPCIDAGNNDAPRLPACDFEGDNRILDGDGNVTAIVDMGVDEVSIDWPYFHVYLPLVLGAN